MFNINNLSHILFDYDGLLVNSEKLYFQTWAELLTEEGQVICYSVFSGNHESETYEIVKPYLKTTMSLQEVSDFKKQMFNKLIQDGKLELMDGIDILLKNIYCKKPISIVSNSTLDIVQEGIVSTNIQDYFKKLFCVDENILRKPAPDLYLKAIHDLGISKESVITFEDSKTGIQSALSAGIRVICISSKPGMKEFCKENNIEYFSSALDVVLI